MNPCMFGLALCLLLAGGVPPGGGCGPDYRYEDDVDYEPPPAFVLGIDLGASYSCVGVYKDGRVEILPNDQGNRITPSYVAFTPEGHRLVGDAAKNQLTSNPENTVYDVKRLIGRKWEDPSVQKDAKYFPFKVINKGNTPHVEVHAGNDTQVFSPEEISAMVLGKMKETAEAYLGQNLSHAVITVPAYFTDAQRQATKDAGTIAGLNVMRIINEPSAAAIAYGFDKLEGEKNVLVFDLGGGTFDVTVLTIDHGVFEIMSTDGDPRLGGEDFDQRVMEYFIKLYKKKTGHDLRDSPRAVQKLQREVEKAKRALSSQHQTRIDIESLYRGRDFSEGLTRAKFEELNMDLFRATLKPIQRALENADIDKTGIYEIILVGGSTRIPEVQQLVKEFFNGKEPLRDIDPDEVVAFGAAEQGGILSGERDPEDIIWLCPPEHRPPDKKISGKEEKDSKLEERVDARNELGSYAYALKKQISDKEKLGGKLSDRDKETLETAVNEQITWLENNPDVDSEEYTSHKKNLEEVVQPIVSKFYQGAPQPPLEGGEDDHVEL